MCLALVIAGAAAAFAQDPEPVIVGISTSEYGNENSVTAEPGEPFWLYVVMENAGFVPSCSFLSWHWEFMDSGYWTRPAHWSFLIEIPSNIWVVNFDSSYGGAYGPFIQIRNPVVSYRANLAHADATCIESLHGDRMTLVRIGVMPLDDQPAEFYLKPHPDDRCGTGLPCYSGNAIDCWPGISLHPSSGSVDAPVFVINGPAPTYSESLTWSSLKRIYD